MKTVIISPTYNESKNISTLIKYIFSLPGGYHLLIIDDNSPDGTADIVRDLQNRYPHLHLKQRDRKRGLGTAYVMGFQWALEKGFDSIVQMDADMSHDPMEIPAMVQLLENYDLVIGSRYQGGVSVVNWPIRRLILSYGANLYTRLVTGMPFRDATGGYKAWRASVLSQIDLESVRSEGYSFQIEMNFRTWHKGFRVVEHPIIFIDRTVGESKMSRKIMVEAMFMVWRFRIWKIFGWNK